MHCGGNANLIEPLSVVSVSGCGLRGESDSMQGRIQPVSASVTGEHPTRAIGAVRSRRESHDPDAWVERAKAWHRTTPVIVVAISRPLVLRYLFTPLDESGAFTAFNHTTIEVVDRGYGLNAASEVARQGTRCCVAKPEQRGRLDRPRGDRR